jgi:DNA end-binding protein Ku
MSSVDELTKVPRDVKAEEIKLAKQVIGTFEGKLDLSKYHDDYRDGLMKIIEAKIDGKEVVAPEVEAPPKVINLMEALKRSLDSVSAAQKKPAKVAALPRRPAVRAEGRKRARA